MIYSLPSNNLYGNKPIDIDLPDSWRIAICSYAGETFPALSDEQIETVLAQSTIKDKTAGAKNAVIVIDDMTRPTPCGRISKAVIDILMTCGVSKDSISFVGATGMHRAMSREDFVRKLGEELVSQFPTYSHNPFFNTVRLGVTSFGIPIEINAECAEADIVIGIGAIFGHPNTGISGGGKLVVPGIASVETIRRYHLCPREKWNRNLEAREITCEASKMLRNFVKIDTLLNGNGDISKIFVGDCRSNIEAHFDEICSFFRASRPEPADIVIANNYFKPSEANVVLNYPEFFSLIKECGDLIVAANSPLGAATHYLYGRWGRNTGGLAYYGVDRLPEKVGRYFAFSRFLDPGTAQQYHFDPKDERFAWASNWSDIISVLGDEPKDVLIMPYAGVPNFSPAIESDSMPTLYIGKFALVSK